MSRTWTVLIVGAVVGGWLLLVPGLDRDVRIASGLVAGVVGVVVLAPSRKPLA